MGEVLVAALLQTPNPQPLAPTLRPDYLLIGHMTRDLMSQPHPHQRAGGTALYAAVAASRLGRRVGLVTAHGPHLEIPAELGGVMISRAPSERTTTFFIEPGNGHRSLRLLDRAVDLRWEDVPESWRSAPLVHLAPVAGEVPPTIISCFEGALLVATPQGWLRRCSEGEIVSPTLKEVDRVPMERLAALVLSVEDLGHSDEAGPGLEAIDRLVSRVPVVVLTRGKRGCIVFTQGRATDIAAYPAREVDTTGAGDVFAAAFFVRLTETSDPLASGRFAACAAALSVEGVGVCRIPDRQQVLGAMHGG